MICAAPLARPPICKTPTGWPGIKDSPAGIASVGRLSVFEADRLYATRAEFRSEALSTLLNWIVAYCRRDAAISTDVPSFVGEFLESVSKAYLPKRLCFEVSW